MRWTVAARMVLVAATVVFSATAAATPQEEHAVAAGVAAPPLAQSFHSVRSYPGVAEPVRLRIPAIGVDTPLLRLGRAPDQSIEVPADYGTAGWFAEGPRPGQPGPAVILGHVDSRAGPGVFFELARLAPGSEVLVDRADGSTVAFRAQRTLRVLKTDFPTDLVYAPTLEPSLRLVTCGGSFDHERRSYLDNVIVYADPSA